MSSGEASQRCIGKGVARVARSAFPLWPERWCVLFHRKNRPLWLPPEDYRFQRCALRYFVADPLKALYARALLRAHALMPGAGVLREARLPQNLRNLLSFHVPLNEPWRCAIRFGTRGPYQKASVLLASMEGDGLALAKVAMTQSADAMVIAEAAWLRQLAAMPGVAARVPRLIADGATLGGRRYLAVTLAPTTRQCGQFTPAHARFLAALGRERLEIHGFVASPRYEALQRGLSDLAAFSEPAARAALYKALETCAAALRRWTGPFVIAQGDFSPWNIRIDRDEIFVFDWEYAHAGGNPLFDVLNYLLMPRAVSGRAISVCAFAAALREAGARARELYPEWSWRHPVVGALALAYLLEVLVHYSLASRCIDGTHPVVRSYWQLMERRTAWLPT